MSYGECYTVYLSTVHCSTVQITKLPRYWDFHMWDVITTLNLDIEDWFKADNVFHAATLLHVADTMKQARLSLQNAATLSIHSELTRLKPIMYNKTRW